MINTMSVFPETFYTLQSVTLVYDIMNKYI